MATGNAAGGDSAAVSLCSQAAYPGDEDLEDLEQDIMVKWKLDQAPDVTAPPEDCQDSVEAQKNLAQARQCLKDGQQCDALVYIDMALEADYLNAALWLQRATVLIALGDLREAFRTCSALPPAERTTDLWKMGGSILDKLGLPVSAETWLRHATRHAPSGDNSAAILFQKTRAKRLYAPLTQDMPVEVTFTSQGRSVHTTRGIKKGEVIFADKPMVLAQNLNTLKFLCCSNCVTSLIRPEDVFPPEELQKKKSLLGKAVKKYWPVRERFPCTCGHETYCSARCQQEAWENHHRVICKEKNPAVAKLYQVCASYEDLTSTDCSAFSGWWSASFSPFLLAKLWAQVICAADRRAKDQGRERPSAQDWALARAPYRRFIAYGSGIKAEVFPKMHDLMQEIFGNLGDGLSYTISKEEFSGRFLQMACNVQSFSDGGNPMGHLCRGVYGDPELRQLLDCCQNTEHEGDFAGLFPVHACMNHSCANNAFVADGRTGDGRPGCHVKAKRDIAAGDEVCSQYIDTSLSRKERRQQLYRAYNFWCQCKRCQFEGDGPTSCTECQSPAKDSKPLPHCSRCKQAWYCSAKCQKKAWKRGHKAICGLS